MNSSKNNDKKEAFRRYWKQQGSNSLIGLAVTLIVIIFLSVSNYIRFSWPIWIVIVLVCWVIHTLWLFHLFLRNEDKGDEKKNP